MPQASVYEKLKEISSVKDKDQRIEKMRQYTNDAALMDVIRLTYSPEYEFLLPKEDPQFRKLEEGRADPGMLYSQLRKIYIYTIQGPFKKHYDEGNKKQIAQCENNFISLLESVGENDAKVVLGMKNNKLPFRNLSEKFIRDALPGLLPEKKK